MAVGVVVASGGYPTDYSKGNIITGLDHTELENTYIFHAGTALEDGAVVNSGGRVLCVVGLGETVADAQRLTYSRVNEVSFDGAFCRRDIGYRAIARERQCD